MSVLVALVDGYRVALREGKRLVLSPRVFCLTVCLAALSACQQPGAEDAGQNPGWAGVCIDADKDGYGFQCSAGEDCNDTDPSMHSDCGCAYPATGCACEEGTAPQDCVVSRDVSGEGALLCKTGKRYCRDSAWTECIGVRSFALPPADETLGKLEQGLVNRDAAAQICDVCFPDCYGVNDQLETITDDDNLTQDPSGGLTLKPSTDTNDTNDPDELDPVPGCTPGVILPQFGQYDNDCDGIPDNYDSIVGLPGQSPPFATSHAAITMDLEPGETASNTFDLQFVLKTVDVYFLIDTTASMNGELERLITDLTTGTFLDDPSTAGNEANNITCASPLGSSTSDASLKTKGIAGNIACLVPNSAFGAGYFREIPFDNPAPNGRAHAFDWIIPYEHRQDISTDVNDTLGALKQFYTCGNQSWPEDDMFALYAVATGGQIYTGWDRPGIEAKSCPDSSNYFGYPCFRRESLPIVVLITDASMMNGPNVDVYNNTATAAGTCITGSNRFTVTTTSCTSDAACQTAYPNQGYFCNYALGSGGTLTGKCSVQVATSTACRPDGVADNYNDDSLSQPNDYLASQTNTMSKTPDATYHRVTGNEDFSTAYDVGTIDNTFITYVGDTRGMTADVTSANFGAACSQWPTTGNAAATSSTTPGYPDAVFKFTVTDPNKTLTISTAGSNHAPTLGIISTGGAGVSNTPPTSITAPASSDTTAYAFSTAEISGNFDYSVDVNLAGFNGTWRRSSFGSCMDGTVGATDTAPDAVFAFTPDSDMTDVSFSIGGTQAVATSDTTANVSPWLNLGNSLGQTLAYYGTTSSSTTNKWTSAQLGSASCRSNTTAANREHMFKFVLATAANMEIRLATPSTYDAVLSVFGPTTTTPVTNSTISTPKSCNRNASGDEVVSGSFAAGTYWVMVHSYGTTNTTGTYTLTVKELTDEAIVLYDSAPNTPTEYTIAGPLGANSNDQFFDYNLGKADGQQMVLNAGDTTATNIHADYLPTSFQQAAGTCSDVSGFSNDAVIEFAVDTTRRVRLETFDGTGQSADQAASFDHVLAIVERPTQLTVTPTAVTNNDATSSARAISASSIPNVVGGYSQFTGATYGNSNSITMASSISPLVMYDPGNADTSTCSSVSSNLQDVVYRFDVDAANQGYYDFDTFGSQSTTYISLHSGSPEALTTVTPRVASRSTPTTNDTTASSSPSGAQSGVFLGSIDGKTVTYSDTTTSATSNKWTDAQFAGCRLVSNSQAHEQVVSFSLSATRTISITATQTSPFDASIALFSTAPVANIGQPTTSGAGFKGCTRISGSPSSNPAALTSVGSGVITGSLPAGTYYLVVYGYQGTNNVGSWSVSIADMTTRQTRTVSGNDSLADGAATVAGVDLGDVRTSIVTYTGTTTSSTANKWTATQAGTGQGASFGCRASGTDDDVHEHVLRFTLSGTTNRNLSIALTRGASSFDPTLAVYSGTGGSLPVSSNLSSRILGCQRAYTVNSPANKVFSGSPVLTGTGNATSGGTITGSFPPGTYYVVVSAATAALNSAGSYTLQVSDVTVDSVTPVAASGGNFSNTALDSGGTLGSGGTGSDAPYYDIGTLTGAGFAYTGAIASTTADKWTGPNMSSANNCQSWTSSTKKRAEHVFRLVVPGNTSAEVSLTSAYKSGTSWSEGVIAYWGSITGIPQVSTNIGSPTSCATTSSNGVTSGKVTLSNTGSTSKTYWIMTYPSSAGNGATYAGAYTLKVVQTTSYFGTATAASGGNFSDASLNSSIVATAPLLDLGTLTSTSTTSYAGTLSTSTPTKWTNGQLGAANARTAGVANDTVAEHLFKFTSSGSANFTVSVTGSNKVALAVFQHAGTIQTHTTLSPTNAQTSNNNSTTASIAGSFSSGTYYVLVSGTQNDQLGTYTLTITPTVTAASSTLQTGGNFSNSSLNSGRVTTAKSFTTSSLDDTSFSGYGDLGTVTATQGYTYSGTLGGGTPRWIGAAVATTNSTTGCRAGSANSSNYEHIFKVTLNVDTLIAVDTTMGTLDAVVGIYGPISATFGSTTPNKTAITPQTAFNNGSSLSTRYCADDTGGYGRESISQTVSTPGTYIIVISSYSGSTSSSTRTGTYSLSVTPSNAAYTATYADFGTISASPKHFVGNLSGSTPNKWTSTQVATSGSTTGCRSLSTSTPGEHVFKFSLSSAAAITATLDTLSGSTDFAGAVSIFGPVTSWSGTTPQTATTLTGYGGSVATCLAVNQAVGTISGQGQYPAGDYLLLVQGQATGDTGDYKITLATDSSYATGGNFSDSALNPGGLVTTTSSFSGLDDSGTVAKYGDFGTVSSIQAYTYSGSLSSSSEQRWSSTNIATSTSLGYESASDGCRRDSSEDSNYEHSFRFYLGSTLDTTVKLTTGSLDAVVTVFGPIASWTSTVPSDPNDNSKTAAQTFNGGSSLTVSACNNVEGSTGSISGSWGAGYYLVLVHARRDNRDDTGSYTLSVGPTNPPTSLVPYADFGTLSPTSKYYAGTLSASTTNKWSATNVGFSSYPNGCRSNSSSTSYEHAFKFSLASTSTVDAVLNTSTGSSPFNGIVSIFGPIASWDATKPKSNTTLTSYGGTVATCANVSQSTGTVRGTYTAGDYLVIVHGETTGTAGKYSLTMSATNAPYTADSQNGTLNGTTTAVVADFGDVTSNGYYYEGSTASAPRKWSDTHLGSTTASCRTTSATTTRDFVREHAFKFTLTKSTKVQVTLSNPNWSGSGAKDWDSVVSLYGPSSADPSVGLVISNPHSCKQTSSADSVLTATLAAGTYYLVVHGDTNNDSGAYRLAVQPDTAVVSPVAITTDSLNAGLNGGANVPNVADFGTLGTTAYYYSGSTASAVSKWIGSDLAATVAGNGSTSAAAGCRAAVDKDSGEHVFKFTLGATSYVSLSLSPTNFDPVLSLFGPLSSVPVVDSPIGTATTKQCFHDSANSGYATSGTANITGTFAAGTYYVMVHGYLAADDVSAKSSGTYTLTVNPNAPVVITSRTVTTNNSAAEALTLSGAAAVDLGTVNNFITTYSGTTSTSTSNKWTDAQIRSASSTGTGAATGCRAATTQDSGREHMLKFTVSGSTALPLRVALTGALDGVVSVFSNSTTPVFNTTVNTFVACSRRSTPASDATTTTFTSTGGVIAGSFPPGDYYAIVHGYSANAVGSYTLTLTDNSTTYTSSTGTTNSAVSGGSGPQLGVDLGTVDGSLITYTGNTTSAVNKWSQAQVSTSGNTGCRATGNDAAREHVLRFTVSTARRVAMRLSTSSGTYVPALSLVGSTAPSTNTTLGTLNACTKVGSTLTTENVATAGYTASSGLITGTLAAGTYYLLVQSTTSANAEGPYTLSVMDADPENLGVADVGRRVQTDGDTGTISFNQWAGGDFAADGNAVANGARYSATDSTPERLYQFTVSGSTKTLTVGLTASFDSVISVFSALPTAVSAGGAQVANLLESHRATGTYDRAITRAFAPGTYYVLVHGYRANNAPTPASGTFTLSVGDDNWQTGLIACNSRGASSKLTGLYLTTGSYYLVLKSGAGTGMVDANYRYTLNVRRTFSEPFIACDHEGYGAGTRRSFIDTTLEGGKTYAVVVRGVKPSDKGTYGVVIRDMTAGTQPLGCANAAGYTSAPNNPNSFTADLQAGQQYYVVVRSNSETSVGTANVRIAHSATAMCAFNNVTFDSVGSSAGQSPYVPSKIVTKLPAGEYYAVVKGNQNLRQDSVKIPTGSTAGIPDDRGRGRYQITFGDASLATNNQQFSPPKWGTLTDNGVYDELASRGIRVITVNSIAQSGQHGSSDLYMREQSRVISVATGATDSSGNAIRKNIGADGSGMGYAVVDAVADFAQAVQMDMSVRLSYDPDDPGLVSPFNRRFYFKARAVAAPSGTSNGCAAPVDTNSDGIFDTHPSCGPGATPRFEIMITNPAKGSPGDPAQCVGGSTPGAVCSTSADCGTGLCSPPYPKNVPINPNDPGGGYLMTLQLVGKDKLSASATPQIVDEIPLYVIPQDVFPDPTTSYPAEAVYEQIVDSSGCLSGETPKWRALYWTDNLPEGTALEWSVCGRDTDAELAACTASDFVTVARVTPGATCTTSADCTNAFCNNPTLSAGMGRCESAIGPSCSTASDCGSGAVCASGYCNYTSDPGIEGVDLAAAAKRFNYKKRVRVRVKLSSNSDHTKSPTVYDYRVDYTCGQNE